MDESSSEAPLILRRLRDRNWRLTVQRRTVAEVLSAPDLHLTAEEIFARARERVPEISRATVYNTLADLQAMGEVEEVQLTPGPVRYDPNANVAHHHLVCENCGEIHDVHPRGLEHLGLSQRDQESFELETVEVTFRGICSRCAEHAT